jgi:hypothetical protein
MLGVAFHELRLKKFTSAVPDLYAESSLRTPCVFVGSGGINWDKSGLVELSILMMSSLLEKQMLHAYNY